MKRFSYLLLLAFPLMSAAPPAQDKYVLATDYAVTIHGTSNHDNWDETVGKVTGSGVIDVNADGSFDLNTINIKMEVNSIKSKSSVMNNKTYSALKASTDPEITFTLSAPVKSIKAAADGNTVAAKGNLTIAGVTKSITMQVKIFMPEKGKLVFQGSQVIKETDYGISPPTALFGMLKTGDDITLNFKTNFILNK